MKKKLLILGFILIDNAFDAGCGKYSRKVARLDEHTNKVWYDKGSKIYYEYNKSKDIETKINILSEGFKQTNPEYNKKSANEVKKRESFILLGSY